MKKVIGLHENSGCWVLNARQGMTCLPTRDDPTRPAVSASPVFSAGPISRESGFLGMGSRRPTQRISPRVSVPFSMHTRFCGSVRSVTGTRFSGSAPPCVERCRTRTFVADGQHGITMDTLTHKCYKFFFVKSIRLTGDGRSQVLLSGAL